MKKKILLLIVLIFVLTGCGSSKLDEYSVNYRLKITDVFSEKITFLLPKNAYDTVAKEGEDDNNPYSLEYYLLKLDQNPIFSNFDDIYNKDIKKYNNGIEVSLDYNYPENYFVYDNYITACFENYDLISGDDFFEVKLSGSFTCNNQIKKLNIEVSSDYKVLESNGKKNDKTYSWSIDDKDFDNVDISYKISRDYDKMSKEANNNKKLSNRNVTIRNIRIAVLVVMLLVVAVFMIRFYFMKKDAE